MVFCYTSCGLGPCQSLFTEMGMIFESSHVAGIGSRVTKDVPVSVLWSLFSAEVHIGGAGVHQTSLNHQVPDGQNHTAAMGPLGCFDPTQNFFRLFKIFCVWWYHPLAASLLSLLHKHRHNFLATTKISPPSPRNSRLCGVGMCLIDLSRHNIWPLDSHVLFWD